MGLIFILPCTFFLHRICINFFCICILPAQFRNLLQIPLTECKCRNIIAKKQKQRESGNAFQYADIADKGDRYGEYY